jgi:hypothetical protein
MAPNDSQDQGPAQNQGPAQPLREADPASLNELFERDPLSLTDSDVESIVAQLRVARSKWAEEEAQKQSRGKKSKPADANLNLDDLGL